MPKLIDETGNKRFLQDLHKQKGLTDLKTIVLINY